MATTRIALNGTLSAEQLQHMMAANAAYRTNCDRVMAENFIDAAEALLVVPLEEVDHSGERARVKVSAIEERLAKAVSWLESERACTATPRHFVPARDWRDS
ncbi:MAG: hypothetical protein AAGJ46_14395 [Planctomycetota bacterium]